MADEDPVETQGPVAAHGSRAHRMRHAMRGLAVDVSPLRRSRDYRLLWTGDLVSQAGRQVTLVAVYVQVFRLTHSAAAVGSVGLAQLVPLVVVSVAAGSVVDSRDRRALLLVSQVAFAVSSGLLLFGALMHRTPVGLVFAGTALSAGVSGLASPTRTAMIPNLVGPDLVPSAIALNQVMFNTTMIAGPAVGGVIIGHLGLPWAYGVDVAGASAAFIATALMRPMPPRREEGERASGLAAIREGFAYLRGRRVLQTTFTIDLVAMIFGMPRALFPVLAVVEFHRGPEVVGLMFSAVAVGAIAGALTAGWVGRIRHQGQAVMWAVSAWGAGIVAFGLAGRHLWLALAFLAVAGAADVISAVFRSTILQISVPDELRGRLSSIHILVVTGGPRLGDFEAGVVAQLTTPTISVVSGGLLCLVGVAVLGVLVPQFRRYHAGTPP